MMTYNIQNVLYSYSKVCNKIYILSIIYKKSLIKNLTENFNVIYLDIKSL